MGQPTVVDKNRIGCHIYMVTIFALLLFRDIFNIGVNKYIFVALTALFFLFSDYLTCVYILVFLMPLFCGLPAAHIRLIALMILLLKNRRISRGTLLLSGFVAAAEVVAATWYPASSFGDVIGYISAPILFFYFLWENGYHEQIGIDYKKCIDLFLLAFAFICGIMLINSVSKASGGIIQYLVGGGFRTNFKETGAVEGVAIRMNANTFADFICVSVSLCLILVNWLKRRGDGSSGYYVLAFVFSCLGILSLSRTCIILLLLIWSIYIILNMKSPKQVMGSIILAVIAVTTVVTIMDKIPALSDSIMNRFQDSNTQTAGGRTELFSAYMDVFIHNPRFMLIGTGVAKYKEIAGVWNSIHNGTQQILVCMGIPGFLIFVYGMLAPVLRVAKENRVPFLAWIPLMAGILFTQTIQFLNPTILMFPYILGYYSIKLYSSESV